MTVTLKPSCSCFVTDSDKQVEKVDFYFFFLATLDVNTNVAMYLGSMCVEMCLFPGAVQLSF